MTSVADPEARLPAGKCAEVSCTAAADGVCANGHASLLDCDLFELEPAIGDTAVAAPSPPARLPLPHGKALRPDELAEVLCHEPATRVVPLGAIKAGKTTLFAVLFEFLTSYRLDGWTYVRSLTTLGFAERSHHASMRSNRDEATTPRTSGATGDQVLHLSARRTSDDAVHTALLADVSGEHVEKLTQTGRREQVLLDAVAGADHLLILVDGEQAADPQTRQNAIRHAVDLVHVLPDLPLPDAARITVVLTKLDQFEDDQIAEEVVEGVCNAVTSRIGAAPSKFAVAARPRPGASVEPGHGLIGLFDHLVEPVRRTRPPAFFTPLSQPSPAILQRVWGAQ